MCAGVSQVPSVLFAPSHLMAIMTLGINSAMVMDCGHTETLALPVSLSCYSLDLIESNRNVIDLFLFRRKIITLISDLCDMSSLMQHKDAPKFSYLHRVCF